MRSRITGPGARQGYELSAPADYEYRISKQTIAELESDFLVPSFERDARAVREELRFGRGFVVVKGLPIDRYTDQEACAIYWRVGAHLGRPISQNVKGDLLYSVRDEGYNLDRDYGLAGVRTSKTTAGLNYHTDSPSMLAGHTPDIVCLLALQPAKSGGESAIVSGNAAHNIILQERPDYLNRLYAPYHVDRRAELPPGESPTLPVPVFAYDGQLTGRYLRLYITNDHDVAGSPLTPSDTDPLDYLDAVMQRPNLPVTFQMQRCDMQFVNNHFSLHSRTEFEDHA